MDGQSSRTPADLTSTVNNVLIKKFWKPQVYHSRYTISGHRNNQLLGVNTLHKRKLCRSRTSERSLNSVYLDYFVRMKNIFVRGNYIKEAFYDWLFVCFIRWRWHQALASTKNSVACEVGNECGENESINEWYESLCKKWYLSLNSQQWVLH